MHSVLRQTGKEEEDGVEQKRWLLDLLRYLLRYLLRLSLVYYSFPQHRHLDLKLGQIMSV
jgi:hypothetical protein